LPIFCWLVPPTYLAPFINLVRSALPNDVLSSFGIASRTVQKPHSFLRTITDNIDSLKPKNQMF
jgi:hypothetical protein